MTFVLRQWMFVSQHFKAQEESAQYSVQSSVSVRVSVESLPKPRQRHCRDLRLPRPRPRITKARPRLKINKH